MVGCDHAAVEAKRVVVEVLVSLGADVSDIGVDGSDPVDYPDIATTVAEAVGGGSADRGILLCGTGIGMAMAANKVPGVRAAVVHDATGARMSRLHNDSNILALGGRVLGERLLRELVTLWMETAFEGGRHQRRLDKIQALEEKWSGHGSSTEGAKE